MHHFRRCWETNSDDELISNRHPVARQMKFSLEGVENQFYDLRVDLMEGLQDCSDRLAKAMQNLSVDLARIEAKVDSLRIDMQDPHRNMYFEGAPPSYRVALDQQDARSRIHLRLPAGIQADGFSAFVPRWPTIINPSPPLGFTLEPRVKMQYYIVNWSNHVLPYNNPVENHILGQQLQFTPVL